MMRRCWLLVVVAFFPALPASAQSKTSHPIVPGFERFYANGKADLAAGGQILLGELNCVSCHRGETASIAKKQAPILDDVVVRLQRPYLQKFLNDPHATKPGTTMPNVLAGVADKEQKVEALVHFLASTGSLKQERPDAGSIGKGHDLYQKVGCVACHGSRDANGKSGKSLAWSVPLVDLVHKYSIPGLATFLEQPHTVRPSGRMPGLLLQPKEAKEIANFLLQGIKVEGVVIAAGETNYSYYEGAFKNLPDFNKLKPKATGKARGFDLGVAKRAGDYAIKFEGFLNIERDGDYKFTTTSDDGSKLYIDGKPVVNNDGIHAPKSAAGKVKLTKGSHAITLAFFNGGGGAELSAEVSGPGMGLTNLSGLVVSEQKPAVEPKKTAKKDEFQLDAKLVEQGRTLFASLGCADCHTMKAGPKAIVSTLTSPALAGLKGDAGCLSATPGKAPQFGLSEMQKSALSAAIKKGPTVSSEPADIVKHTFTTLNCYACHVRDQVGGVEDGINEFFLTTQKEMGDEGRLPPPLSGVGAKMHAAYLKKIFSEGSHDRPYMHTRMPKFGEANVGDLVKHLTSLDKLTPAPEVKFAVTPGKVRTDGRHMVGGQVFGCVKCHTFAGNKAEGVQGIDMLLIPQRVTRDWFHAYLLDPQKVRPGTRMPAAWPKGESLLPNLLDGTAGTQIEAIWVYLGDGKGANLPVGVGGSKSIPLIPISSAIIYRNFIQGSGARAIGVGYPERLSLTFDANEMRLSMLWQGAFIDAGKHWNDRGTGYQSPLGDNILKLPDGPAFAFLPTLDAQWPTGSSKTHGYKFTGYRLTQDDRPTFLYSFGDVSVADFPNAVVGKETGIKRVLTLTAAKESPHLYFRAAVGSKIEAQKDGTYLVDGSVKMLIEGATPQIRPAANGKMELIVPATFKDGKATISQTIVW